MIDAEVIVVGLGPAGRAVAHRVAAAGLDVLAVDPRPDRPWTATYAAWLDELPRWLPESVLAARVAEPAAWTTHPHRIPRPYGVFDTSALQRSLALDCVRVCAARADVVDADHVVLADGAVLRAPAVIDARGVPAHRSRAQQTAFGVIVDTATAAPALQGRAAWFMDWRRDNRTGSGDAPSFLYAVPLGQDRVLLEETCLVGRPAIPLPELQRRLEVRLAARGVN
ncbi:lycopene cyclase family protein [Rhodococcus rhodochrous]|uniref:lycopene cyclase family protein n=1 Tax=Rhodococcus rhodochrous TaxID=1829 RepID=UPI000A4F68C5|nr:lycopene cyclase family protein [Rhodococcus rhodochrous]